MSNIIEVTHNTIRYFDNEQNEQEINLFECSKNWVDYFNSRDTFFIWDSITQKKEPAPKISVESNICVGERDWFAKKPYIEFFSSPKIRFEICPKMRFIYFLNKKAYFTWKHYRYYKEFYKLQADLEERGWSTFDLG